ncbi:hypothetical protein GCWU000341_01652 [Oribacterium sp. oral taxon 078 str. F0262]|nr:hypothetical protein GCWU000341_01652 [Oribacterium sp. oral taxon 078 str. F0262]
MFIGMIHGFLFMGVPQHMFKLMKGVQDPLAGRVAVLSGL